MTNILDDTYYDQAMDKINQYNPFVNIPKRVCSVKDVHNGEKKWVRNCQSNHVVVIRDCSNTEFLVVSNQRVYIFYMINCTNCKLTVLDSVVIVSRSCVAINCDQCSFVFEDVDMRKLECYGVTNSVAVFIECGPVTENSKVFWRHGCSNNKMQSGYLTPADAPHSINYNIKRSINVPDVKDVEGMECKCYFDEQQRPHAGPVTFTHGKNHGSGSHKHSDRILAELEQLEKIPFTMTREELDVAYDDERVEMEEPVHSVMEKVKKIATMMKESQYTVVYSGAGISTAANIPDFRGPQGVWTLKAKGVSQSKNYDEEEIHPTYSHYAITELARHNLINYVMTTNMDALHVRSGLPLHLICEQHGNSHKEMCEKCRKAYYRQYGTTYGEDFFTHKTGRKCTFCNGELRTTIVNFSENLTAEDMSISLLHARKSHLSIVLGTSMNVQPAASFPDKCFKNNGKLIIVNLQKTPYDSVADVRIYCKTDIFMQMLMQELGIADFDRSYDCISTWDEPTPDVLLPPHVRRRIAAQDKRRKQFIISATAIAALVLSVSVGFSLRYWRR
eukprot:TRINITY_DN4772_c0_g1_i1.p1 TRINITY_DN4772_c0_g1~~TRINITY_DN4772_c0_g1_i1.p1  ORF type:complete len:560 (+),score=103.12 TRINITY_DN4772_c0_g1_i1:354-2033(+)